MLRIPRLRALRGADQYEHNALRHQSASSAPHWVRMNTFDLSFLAILQAMEIQLSILISNLFNGFRSARSIPCQGPVQGAHKPSNSHIYIGTIKLFRSYAFDDCFSPE